MLRLKYANIGLPVFYPEGASIANEKAKTIAEAILRRWVSQWGPMQILVTDNAKQLKVSEVMTSLHEILGIDHRTCTAYHPEGNAPAERANRILLEILTKVASEKPSSWKKLLPVVEWALNSSVQKSTGYSAHHLMTGREASGIENIAFDLRTTKFYQSEKHLVAGTYKELRLIFSIAAENKRLNHEIQKKVYDKNRKCVEIQVGNRVLLYRPKEYSNKYYKLSHNFKGPFLVTKSFSSGHNFEILHEATGKLQIVHRNHLRLLPPDIRGYLSSGNKEPPPTEDEEESASSSDEETDEENSDSDEDQYFNVRTRLQEVEEKSQREAPLARTVPMPPKLSPVMIRKTSPPAAPRQRRVPNFRIARYTEDREDLIPIQGELMEEGSPARLPSISEGNEDQEASDDEESTSETETQSDDEDSRATSEGPDEEEQEEDVIPGPSGMQEDNDEIMSGNLHPSLNNTTIRPRKDLSIPPEDFDWWMSGFKTSSTPQPIDMNEGRFKFSRKDIDDHLQRMKTREWLPEVLTEEDNDADERVRPENRVIGPNLIRRSGRTSSKPKIDYGKERIQEGPYRTFN